MEDMPVGEIAAMYQEGEDAVIMISRELDDDTRCDAVNRLLGKIAAKPHSPVRLVRSVSSVAVLLFFAHLCQQMAGATSQGLQPLWV